MTERNCAELLEFQYAHQKHVCVGLDTDIRHILKNIPLSEITIPLSAQPSDADIVLAYNKMVIDATADIAAVYKPNTAFYKFLGRDAADVLRETVKVIHAYPHTAAIIDGKYGDIGTTNEGHVYEAFDYLDGDAATVHPYLGAESLRPFLEKVNKGIFVLARTSNPGGGEFQDLETGESITVPLYQYVAHSVANNWNTNGNCGLVAGATYPEEAEMIRKIVGPDIDLLIPGVGGQGGEAKIIVPKALRKGEKGIINSSRGIIFPKRLEGERLQDAIRRSALTLHQEIVLAQAA